MKHQKHFQFLFYVSSCWIVNWDFNESHSSRGFANLLCSLGDISSLLYVNPSSVTPWNKVSHLQSWQSANLSIISPTYHMLYTCKCISELATAVVKTYVFSQQRKGFLLKIVSFSSIIAFFDLFYFTLKLFFIIHCEV